MAHPLVPEWTLIVSGFFGMLLGAISVYLIRRCDRRDKLRSSGIEQTDELIASGYHAPRCVAQGDTNDNLCSGLDTSLEIAWDALTIANVIGVGGFSKVYSGRYLFTNGPVAVRFSTKQLNAIKDEIKTWGQIHHTNIVSFLGWSRANGDLCTVHERCSVTLKVADGTITEKLSKLSGIANALSYLHGEGYSHQNVTAQHVLVATDGSYKLASNSNIVKLNVSVVGFNVPWASPQLILTKTAHAEDDIWAFGGLIYEVLSGEIPYNSICSATDIDWKLRMQKVADRIVSNNLCAPPPSLNHFTQWVWDEIVMKCWRQDEQITLATAALRLLHDANPVDEYYHYEDTSSHYTSTTEVVH